MIVESISPQPQNTPFAQLNNFHAEPARTSSMSNVPTFASTFRVRALSSGCEELDAIFDAAGRKYNLSPDLLKAVAKVESTFRTNATSPAGAMGIMQLMPGTAKYLGVDDPFDPTQNIMGGARYLREQLDRFDGDIKLALAAYNAGWPTVQRHGGIPPFKETQAYVQRVLGHLGGVDFTPNMIAYNGPNPDNRPAEAPTESTPNNTFDFNEAMAHMMFMQMMNMQMNLSNNGGR